MKRNKGNRYYYDRRRLAKHGYFAPEQFGQEWELLHVTHEFGPEVSGAPMAGQYTERTNVWGIALTMWQLITQLHVPEKPQPQSSERLPLHYCPLLLEEAKYSYIDIRFRTELARCMSHEPKDRPTLRALLQHAEAAVHRTYPAEDDNFIRDWVSRVFYQGNAPANPPNAGGGGAGGNN